MGSGVTLEVGRCDADAVAALLHGLPEWFGIEDGVVPGALPWQDMLDVWSEDNPRLIMVKAL